MKKIRGPSWIAVTLMVAGCAGLKVGEKTQPVVGTKFQTTKISRGKTLELVATKNARVFFHPSEAEFNGGGCHRLRTADIRKDNGDVSIIDFDRTALKAFLERHEGRAVSAKLILAIRDLDQGPAKLEVAALNSGSDWNQGTKSQEKAEVGEVCYAAAQFGVKPWTTPDGKPVRNLGEIFYDRRADSLKTLLNSGSVTVKDIDKMNFVTIEMDPTFVEHLANAEYCRGIIVFTRSESARVYFSSRDKEGKEPRLIVSAK
ncbi:MAG: hypothetical protein N2255_06720 [Kiritimatiellae bacterium]|nr:hypothetical protein [Kiritimatiellia bacterium]